MLLLLALETIIIVAFSVMTAIIIYKNAEHGRAHSLLQQDYEKLLHEKEELEQDLRVHMDLKEAHIRLEEKLASEEERRKNEESARQDLQRRHDAVSSELLWKSQGLAALEMSNKNLIKKIEEDKALLEQNKEMLKKEFENISSRILQDNSSRFQESSKNQLDIILKPFKEDVEGFKKVVSDKFGETFKSHAQLQGAIDAFVKQQVNAQHEVSELTRALKGSSKVQVTGGNTFSKVSSTRQAFKKVGSMCDKQEEWICAIRMMIPE